MQEAVRTEHQIDPVVRLHAHRRRLYHQVGRHGGALQRRPVGSDDPGAGFRRESGDLRDIEGTWSFFPLGGGKKTLLVYRLRLDLASTCVGLESNG